MIVKVLGALDLFAAIIVLFNTYFSFIAFPSSFLLVAGLYLLIKGGIFALVQDFTSFIDIGAGLIIILAANMHLPHIIMGLVFIYLLQKGVISIVS